MPAAHAMQSSHTQTTDSCMSLWSQSFICNWKPNFHMQFRQRMWNLAVWFPFALKKYSSFCFCLVASTISWGIACASFSFVVLSYYDFHLFYCISLHNPCFHQHENEHSHFQRCNHWSSLCIGQWTCRWRWEAMISNVLIVSIMKEGVNIFYHIKWCVVDKYLHIKCFYSSWLFRWRWWGWSHHWALQKTRWQYRRRRRRVDRQGEVKKTQPQEGMNIWSRSTKLTYLLIVFDFYVFIV